jgi:GNAT superfamily N-acetyltransferase
VEASIELLDGSHIKSDFDCGYEMLNTYLSRQASQDVKRDLAACYVLADESKKIIGYYTLSGNSIKRDQFPEELARKLPQSYADLPAALLGRLAVSKDYRGQGYGEFMLMDALNRCAKIAEHLGTLAVMVDPIDEKAESFYIRYGFTKLPGSSKMFITIKTIRLSWLK